MLEEEEENVLEEETELLGGNAFGEGELTARLRTVIGLSDHNERNHNERDHKVRQRAQVVRSPRQHLRHLKLEQPTQAQVANCTYGHNRNAYASHGPANGRSGNASWACIVDWKGC